VEVDLFEQGPVPNPLSSSHDAHRLIREAYGSDLGYTRLVNEAWGAWGRLWGDLGVDHYVPTGTLALATEDSGWTHDSRAALERLGCEHHILQAEEVAERFPWLVTSDVQWALSLESGGVLLADRILESLAAHLVAQGVTIHEHTRVLGVDPSCGLLELAGESREFDALVIAAGPWTPKIRADLADRITPSRQVLAFARPPQKWAKAWAESPMLLDVGSAGFYAVPPVAGTGLKIGDHSFSLTGDPSAERRATAAEVQAVFQTAQSRFVDFSDYALDGDKVCFYSVEPTERFVLDRRERMWGISGLSGHGFKFGALLGEGIAAGVLGDRDVADLARWAAGKRA